MKLHLVSTIVSMVFLLCAKISFAEDFWVTSNADAGPGTLREAITKANGNPDGPTDRILFNLSGSTLKDRTITVLSGLPALRPGLIIDGTSQSSATIGISDAKVIVEYYFNSTDGSKPFILFDALASRDIWVYGLYLRYIHRELFNRNSVGLRLEGAKNIHIGEPGKGNIISGWSNAIGDIPLGGGSYIVEDADSIFIKSNILGLREDGDKLDFDHPVGFPNALNVYSVFFRQVKNIQIGGPLPSESNLIAYFYNAVSLMPAKSGAGFCRIMSNKFGCNANETEVRAFDWTNYKVIEVSLDSSFIQNNLILGKKRGAGISLESSNGSIISGNFIGVFRDGRDAGCGFLQGIILNYVTNSTVGGVNAGEKNVIGYTTNISAIYVNYCPTLTISRNSVYCNRGPGSIYCYLPSYTDHYTKPIPFVTINSLVGNTYSGKTVPNALVEIFTDDLCNKCDANIYLTTVQADKYGNWSYNSSVSGPILATATDDLGTTSSVSSAEVEMQKLNFIPSSCGKANGAITGVKIISGTSFHWENDLGEIVSRDTNLVNVPSGSYRLVVDIGKNNCGTKSSFYRVPILAAPDFDSSNISVTNPSCGLPTGKIMLTKSISINFDVVLRDYSGKIISSQIRNLAATQLYPGDYFLTIEAKSDSACVYTFPIKLKNKSGASLNFSRAKITSSTCGLANGTINNILIEGAVGKSYFRWTDSTGKIVGNSLDLAMVHAGRYRLHYKDEGGCDTIITPYFTLGDTGSIKFDTSGVIILPSNCTTPTGSITGIKLLNATSITWINPTNGAVVANSVDLTNTAAGTYTLVTRNNLGCSAELPEMAIPASDFPAFTFTISGQPFASCNTNNGSVLLSQFSINIGGFNFWITDSSNRQVSQNQAASNLAAGKYYVYAKDPNGCEKKLTTWTVTALPMPAFSSNQPVIRNDQCDEHTGSITNIEIQHLTGPTIYRWISGTDTISTSKDLVSARAGRYRLLVTDAGNCTIQSESFNIINTLTPLTPARALKLVVPRNESATFQVNKDSDKVTYCLYEDSLGNRLISKNMDGKFTSPKLTNPVTYYVRLEKGSCYSPFSTVFIDVTDDTEVYIPNVFTPNNDGKNDQLRVLVHGIFNLEKFKIFDAWGNLVFQTSDIIKGWDGSHNGVFARSGTYAWLLEGRDIRGKKVLKKGTVTLIRR